MKKLVKIFTSLLLVVSVFFGFTAQIALAGTSSKIPKGKDSIIYGEPLGPDLSKVGKPKKLNFKIDYENYDLKFTDIPEDHEYRKAIIWAVENGILKNEQRDLNPNEVIKKREALLILQDLRYKYHYKKRTKFFMDWYKKLIRIKYIPENLIKRSYPEAIALYSIQNIIVPIYEPKSLIRQTVCGDVFYDIQLSEYNPDAPIKRNFLFFLAGIPYDDGFISATDPHIHTANSDEWRDNLVKTNAKKILRSWLNGKKIRIPKDYGKEYNSYYGLHHFKFGIGFMQRIGFLKVDPAFEDLKIDNEVKRGEFFEFIYRMCKHIQEDKLGKDFRKTPPWQY